MLLSIITIFIALIILRLFTLQVISHGYYERLASNQHEFEQVILPKRGDIYLQPTAKDSQPLLVATNVTKNLVYVNPKEIENPGNTAAKLSKTLEMPEAEILDKLAATGKNYVPLKKQLSDETSDQIQQMKLPGVYLEPEDIRLYPEGNLASQVLGFVGYRGDQRVGQYGIEGRYEQQLSGSKGIMGSESDVAGRWITFASRNFTPAQDGDTLYLTLDPAIQFKAQEVLKKTVQEHGAENGSVIVVNPKTGAILAMANYPDFNPNEYGKAENVSQFANNAVSIDYEPGSVFKAITMAAALNEGRITPDTTYEDTGQVEIDGHTIKNSDPKPNGIQNMKDVLDKSLNTGLVFVEQQLGHTAFQDYVQKFGFGKDTGIELPGESAGDIKNLDRKGDVFFATASFGQGITVTPLQMVQAYTAIANGGKMMQPYIVETVKHADGVEEPHRPKELGKVIDSKTAATLSAMLVDVVENGHGKRAAVKGYFIAGKTGTAQVAYKDRQGYDPNRNIGSFVGFGPVDNPQFLAIVKIDSPRDVKFAESTAAPAFGEIASFILNYLQIPPTRQ
ncbi:MAG: peptidoglycan D,D-transpeptidase FtsI family protein [Candidatus Saccharibacteria bacterium]